MPGLVFIELLISFPALLLAITSFCTIFKRKIFRIGLPIICFSGLIFLSVFALQTRPHDMEKCFFLIPLVILPIIVLDIFMVIRLFSSIVNEK